ncbi:hypothetical protein F383_27450 [Gossypium arboreum]|uniref:Uncharacterized protein n=1 Tax=Gossypium arboreum TaxID=29729 RepID=A0A0B0PBR7_GOSAR|nr:hypothetical protein F383_27450 [Gossypium arboreum]
MPHRTRPMTALLVFTGLNAVLVSTITPVYDFVCFLPFWERRHVLLPEDFGWFLCPMMSLLAIINLKTRTASSRTGNFIK